MPDDRLERTRRNYDPPDPCLSGHDFKLSFEGLTCTKCGTVIKGANV